MPYRMIGIDLDGTLLDGRSRLREANVAAIERARQAGVMVVPCTGRAWRESRHVLEKLRGLSVGVFVGGAMVNRIDDGRSLDLAVIEPRVVRKVVDALFDLPEAVLLFREANLAGHDYLVTGRGSLSPQTQWWFERTGASVQFTDAPTEEDLHHTLRIGIVAEGPRVEEVAAMLGRDLTGSVFIQNFAAVQEATPGRSIHVLEIFAPDVDKWRGLTYVADRHGIAAAEIAVIGDEINDLAMVRGAGCGIAMGNAIDAVKAAADHVTASNDADGVAAAIDRLLSGQWT
jgi:5-amino-6-(5-phospho-D-ribitylamino)uracil phosphatase